ncbi:MAG: polysaccharide deacetylase family protein [Lachnospiraceae bacterium]|nr:polysaccharide deacetylase family protein [Lachnospiraceae bacterium]
MKSLQEHQNSITSLYQEINTSYMKVMTVILLAAVCLYAALSFHTAQTNNQATISTLSSSSRGELPIYSVETEERVVALTFDAAWGDEDLADILATLESHQAKATFFVSGDWVDRYPDAVQSIHAAGHELANHGTNHKHMPQLSQEEMIKEIMECHQQVYALTQTNMTAFRAPYSDWNDQVVKVAKSCGYSSINQNVDSVDWKDYGVDSIIQTVMEDPDLDNGAIILLHNGATYTSAALDELLTQLENEGYTFVPISELIYTDNYTLDHTGRQFPAS